jgi:predicted lipoprotein with Yx(FWY)xxD motif
MQTNTGILLAAMILTSAACGEENAASSAGSTGAETTAAGATASPSTATQPASSASSATSTPATSSTPATATSGVRVRVARTDQLGVYLTDANGRALYLLEEDRRGQSTCYEMCAAIWPPLLAGAGTPGSADPSVRGDLLGSAPRQGGGSQVTYNGHPLYYYLGDARPGQTRGHHVEDSWGEWYLVSPGGQHVGEDGERGGRRGRGGRGGRDDR